MSRTLVTRTVLALLLGCSGLAALALPASAACHIAAFDGETFDTPEGEMVTITVVLQGGQPSCEGSVDYSTQDGTAVAGDDYESVDGTLTFEQGDDREETITVPVLADEDREDPEDFMVVLTGGTEGISASSGVATVTILDADGDTRSQAEIANEDLTSGGGFNTTPIIIAVIALAVIGGAAFVLTRGHPA